MVDIRVADVAVVQLTLRRVFIRVAETYHRSGIPTSSLERNSVFYINIQDKNYMYLTCRVQVDGYHDNADGHCRPS